METDGRRAKDPPVGTVVFAARKMGLEETLWSMKTRVYQDWGGAKEMIYLDFRKFRFTSFFIQRETAEQKTFCICCTVYTPDSFQSFYKTFCAHLKVL